MLEDRLNRHVSLQEFRQAVDLCDKKEFENRMNRHIEFLKDNETSLRQMNTQMDAGQTSGKATIMDGVYNTRTEYEIVIVNAGDVRKWRLPKGFSMPPLTKESAAGLNLRSSVSVKERMLPHKE